MSAPSIDEQIAEVQREIAERQRHFDRWLFRAHLTPEQALQRIACMDAALKTLETVRRLEELW